MENKEFKQEEIEKKEVVSHVELDEVEQEINEKLNWKKIAGIIAVVISLGLGSTTFLIMKIMPNNKNKIEMNENLENETKNITGDETIENGTNENELVIEGTILSNLDRLETEDDVLLVGDKKFRIGGIGITEDEKAKSYSIFTDDGTEIIGFYKDKNEFYYSIDHAYTKNNNLDEFLSFDIFKEKVIVSYSRNGKEEYFLFKLTQEKLNQLLEKFESGNYNYEDYLNQFAE